MENSVDIPVEGMTCATCVVRIEKKLSKAEGVSSVSVNLAGEKASVTFDPDKTSREKLVQVIEDAGYQVPKEKMESAELSITGMTCANCVTRIEKKVGKMHGVTEISVNLGTEIAKVNFNGNLISISEIIGKIQEIGYGAKLFSVKSEPESEKQNPDLTELSLALLLTFPFVLIMLDMVVMVVNSGRHLLPHFMHTGWFQFWLALPVQVWFGRKFHSRAWKAFTQLSPDMNVLVSLGSWAAFGFSVYSMLSGGEHLYFESGTMVISLVMLGKYLEKKARKKSGEAIGELLNLVPKTCVVLKNSTETITPVSNVVVDDLILVRPGEYFPVDGVIVTGLTAADESLLTGESLPVEKARGESVKSGTLNLTGVVTIKAEKVGFDTVLSGIIKLVEQAQTSKPPVQILADKIAGVFVPVVMVISLITFGFWFLFVNQGHFEPAFLAAISVLVIACPCALGLATPISVLVATGRSAKNGILFRNGSSLENFGKIQILVLDKTGTLTSGKMTVRKVHDLNGFGKEKILAMAASLARLSVHPLSNAIREFAEERLVTLLDIQNVSTHTGAGLKGDVDGKTLITGKKDFVSEGIGSEIPGFENNPNPLVYVRFGDEIIGVIELTDQVKESSSAMVEFFELRGIDVWMLTGDRMEVAASVAEQTGITKMESGQSPEDKANFIKELMKDGKRVAFVGDGMNDAAALTCATVGLAMGSGSDIAINAGSITILNNRPESIVTAFQISKAASKNIQQNFGWAFGYNLIGIPIAAMGLLTPWIAGGAMAFSSVSVVSNALRLKRVKL